MPWSYRLPIDLVTARLRGSLPFRLTPLMSPGVLAGQTLREGAMTALPFRADAGWSVRCRVTMIVMALPDKRARIERHPPRLLWPQVYDDLRAGMNYGQLAQGTRLAGELELADQYAVSQDTFSTESYAYPEFDKPEWRLTRPARYYFIVRFCGYNVHQRQAFGPPYLDDGFGDFRLRVPRSTQNLARRLDVDTGLSSFDGIDASVGAIGNRSLGRAWHHRRYRIGCSTHAAKI